MQKEIEFIIDKDGNIVMDQINFVGSECSKVADEFAKALGKKVKQDKKCDYFQSETTIRPKVPIQGF